MLILVVDNRVRVRCEALGLDLQAELKAACEHTNPEFHKRLALGLSIWGAPRTVRTWRHERDTAGEWLTFPRGALARVRTKLEEAGLDWEELDAREDGRSSTVTTVPDYPRALWDHQREMVAAALQRQNCLVRAPTGSGKTGFALGLVAQLKLPTVVVVHNTALHKQWVDRCARELGMKKRDVGQIKGGAWKPRDLTVAMQKSLAIAFQKNDPRALRLAEDTALLVCDEVHLFAAKTFVECVDPFRAKYRIGVSADHRRKDQKEFLVEDLFGAVAVDIDKARLVAAGVVLDVEVRVVPTDFRAPWYAAPEDEHDERELDFGRLLEEMGADAARTQLALDAAASALGAGEQVLLMTHRREMCRHLDLALAKRDVRTGFLMGDAAQEFDATVRGLKDGTVRAAVGTYQACGTGLDLPRVGVGVAVTPIASNRQFLGQVVGRLCRGAKGKTVARLYYLWDRHVFPRHLRNLAAWNRKVVVWDGKAWVDAKKHLKAARAA